MRLAIIDLGTNSVRFDVHDFRRGKPIQLHREKLLVRLGQGVFLTGKLDSQAIRRTLHAFESFAEVIRSLKVDHVIAFATAALRETPEGASFLKLLKEKTGIELKIISGEEEAHTIARGVLSHEKNLKGSFALIDIGGGSTEITVCRNKSLLFSTSFPLGAARLQQIFLKASPPAEDGRSILKLRQYIRGVLAATLYSENWPKVPVLVGSSGTIRTFGRILGKGSKTFTLKALSKLVDQMKTMSLEELLSIDGIESKRADMILAGGLLLEECAKALGAKSIRMTEYSLRDGILAEQMDLYQQKKNHIKIQKKLHLDEFYEKADELGSDRQHREQICLLATSLFQFLRRLHQLPNSWLPYLQVASILHDIGETISPSDHSKHSYYIVKNAHFMSLEPWEEEFIAQLCLWHSSGKLQEMPLDALTKEHREPFLKLLSLLRIADALDRSRQSHVKILGVRNTKTEVTLKINSKLPADLNILRVEQKKGLFEHLFKKVLHVEAQD